MPFTTHIQSLLVLMPRGWNLCVFLLVFLFFGFSLAKNTDFQTHIATYTMGVFAFSVLTGAMLREVLGKPLSFCLPGQARTFAPVIIGIGLVFCALFISTGLQLISWNEDHLDYPLRQIEAAFIPLFCWSLCYYFIIVGFINRSLLGGVVVYILLGILGFDGQTLADLHPQDYPLVSMVAALVSCVFCCWVIVGRRAARSRIGASWGKDLPGIVVKLQGRVFDGLNRILSNSIGRSSRLALLLTDVLGKFLLAMFISMLILSGLLTSFINMDYVQSSYLLLFPLIPLCFPFFRPKSMGRISASPWLPKSRMQYFVSALRQGFMHYLLGLMILGLVYASLTILSALNPEAKWLPYAIGAIEIPLPIWFLASLLAPLAAFYHEVVRPMVATMLVTFVTGMLGFAVFENELDNLQVPGGLTMLLVTITCCLPLVLASYINNLKRDQLVA